jgi:hypothetical protein
MRLERLTRTSAADARKKDRRERFELGGLIVKAGLRFENPALLLGLLIDGAARLKTEKGARERLTSIGAEALGDGGE